jgi:hypothetical protein
MMIRFPGVSNPQLGKVVPNRIIPVSVIPRQKIMPGFRMMPKQIKKIMFM